MTFGGAMEALFLILIGAVLFSQSWQLLGLYSDNRTTGLLMLVLGGITVLAAISASLYEPMLINGDGIKTDIATETMVMKVVIVSWAIYAIVGGAQYLWDFDERANGFYSGFIAISTFCCMIYFSRFLEVRYGVETWLALSGATLILSLIAGFNFFHRATEYSVMRLVCGWSMLLGGSAVALIGLAVLTRLLS